MFRLKYRKKIALAVRAKCLRHPRYDPAIDGKLGVKDRCSTCYQILDLHQAFIQVDDAIRELERKAYPWIALQLKSIQKSKSVDILIEPQNKDSE
jgi:hypothetical protein